MNLRTFAFASLALAGFSPLVTGCGGASATVDGTIAGDQLPPSDAISANVNLTSGNITFGTAGAILISTEPGSCDLSTAKQVQKNSKFLVVSVGDLDSSHLKLSPPTGPGTFSVWTFGSMLPATSGVASVRYVKYDAACKTVEPQITGSNGTVTLTAVNQGAYTGTGSVTLSSGDHIDFEFNSARCDTISALVDAANNNMNTTFSCL